MSALDWKWDGARVRVSGRIDENADLARLAAEMPSAPLVTIDLGELVRINSIGVREWMDFMASLRPREVRLERCASVFVDQLNAIANFSGGATIGSTLAPYDCDADGSVLSIEVQTSDARRGSFPPTPACPRCGNAMLPAFEDELYYRFLKYTR